MIGIMGWYWARDTKLAGGNQRVTEFHDQPSHEYLKMAQSQALVISYRPTRSSYLRRLNFESSS